MRESTSLVACKRSHLELRCRERGYSMEEAMPCVVSKDGESWVVDISHPAYPSKSRIPYGAGSHLKRLLKNYLGIVATPNCSCNANAKVMDLRGPDWVEANMDTVVGWLREEATKRGLPFFDAAGRMLVRRAIKNARKAAKN